MKIKYRLLERFVNLTNKENDFLLYVARFQNEKGEVIGIYYRDIMKNCGMCKQTFYAVLRSLVKKGIITYMRENNDYNITILDNDFSYPESYSEGYINLSRKIFSTKKFRNLKAKEKILLLLFLKVTHENASSYQIRTKNFYDKYTKLLGVTVRVLRGYLHSLRKFFSIGVKDGKYFITYLSGVFEERLEESEVNQYLDHVVKVGCRRNKVNGAPTAVQDTIQVIKQYRKEAREAGQNILDILNSCLTKCKDGILNGKYIHKLVRKELGIENRPIMEV